MLLGSALPMAKRVETRGSVLRDAMRRKIVSRTTQSARMTFPAVPAMVDLYEETLAQSFAAVGRGLSKDERSHLRAVLVEKLDEAFRKSPHSKLLVTWETDPAPAASLSWTVTPVIRTMVEEYREWTETRTPPLFGKYPDAKVMEVARSLGVPSRVRCLDLGAGTGRNAIPLAEEGFPTTAVELSEELAAILALEAKQRGVTLEVIRGDALSVTLPPGAFRLAFLCEVVTHFREVHEVATLLHHLAKAVTVGGKLLFSAFVAIDGYTPDKQARDMSEYAWSSLFTRRDLASAAEGSGFVLVSDESVHDFEKVHLPADGFPPTSWFVDWTEGRDVFPIEGKPPIDLRWLLFERRG